jgi:hypothetical protein
MILEKALTLAGDNAHVVARPTGRLHLYTGPLTRSGRFIPRGARAVCRTRTRRLEVVDDARTPSSLSLETPSRGRLLCARCSARLASRRAEQHPPTTRAAFLAAFRDLTKADVAVALELATTPAEVDAAAHLSLVLFDVAGTLQPFTEHRRQWPALQQLVHRSRVRVHGFPESHYVARERADAQTAAARELAIARRREAKAEREARIARLGVTNAQPTRTAPASRTRGARR